MALTIEEKQQLDEARGELIKANEAFKKKTEELTQKEVALGKAVARTEDLQKVMDEKTKEIDLLLTKLNRPAVAVVDPEEMKFAKKMLLRKALKTGFDPSRQGLGMGSLTPEELKVLAINQDPSGGYLTSTEYVNEIIKAEVQFSPVREYARKITTSKPSITLRKRTRRPGVTKKVEGATGSENTNIAWGKVVIAVKNYFSEQIATNELLEDADFNIEEQISMDASFEFGVSQGTDFIKGATNGPEGILQNPNINVVTTKTSPTFTADDVINFYYGIYEGYAKRGVFMFNRDTIRLIRGFKSDTGVYLWQPGLNGDASSTLMGRPIREAIDLTAQVSSAFTSGDKIGIFADFERLYGIVDRVGINILRDPYSLSGSFETKYVLTQRTGGAVLDENAGAILKVQ
jgi:HK97 family phage major capsid protein